MMNEKLRNAVKYAEFKLNEADVAIQNIERYLTFVNFNHYEPQVTSCNGSEEIILVYYGREMHIERAIEIMEYSGYITPDDFK